MFCEYCHTADSVGASGANLRGTTRWGLLRTSTLTEESTSVAGMQDVQCSRKMFDGMLSKTEVQQVLDDLKISLTNPGNLFDMLDADGDGVVTIIEVAEGLFK